ncbi:hypothetical protein EUTSA_v10019791mg [Eutrema salsugineum]|uniref:F-box domain-containing protein n=1 Tax=Eutrema salsugineum TaxID=72664 RepID=V4JSJ0_EUTSA|nr:jacalin-related lectin 38 [Eutrema salsugineum]ESQ28255.1 hypothetical protein EUTSA_v10019791mg [Eutrema salsugineum]
MVASEMLLPWDLVEEILSWVPVKSLIRFRTFCKRWKALFEEKRFAKNQLARASRPQFILSSESMICSVDVILDGCPLIEVCKVPVDITGYRHSEGFSVNFCDGLLLCAVPSQGLAVRNPWLKQARWINMTERTYFNGIGYKIFASPGLTGKAWISEFGSSAWKSHELVSEDFMFRDYSVSLNGTLYWIARNFMSREYVITSFDFSTEKFNEIFCVLPDKSIKTLDSRSLEVFRRDRFSYLHQCYETKNIEIWVTKKKIENKDGESVEWMMFMNVSVPYSSDLRCMSLFYQRSYFIDEKTLSLVLCCEDYNGNICIYIVKGQSKRIQIEAVAKNHCLHRTYFPSLVQVPSYQRQGEEI